jgi:Uma2 family endonuclease
MPQVAEPIQGGPEPAPNRVRWTRRQCEALQDAGFLTGRYELIDGEIISKMGQTPPHTYGSRALMAWPIAAFGADRVAIQATLDLVEHSPDYDEPEPDAMVTVEGAAAYVDRHPRPDDLLLLVEVADSSVRFDRTAKAALYARSGVREYWIVDIPGRRVLAHRQPSPGGYIDITSYGGDEALSPLARPEATVRVADLLPPV